MTTRRRFIEGVLHAAACVPGLAWIGKRTKSLSDPLYPEEHFPDGHPLGEQVLDETCQCGTVPAWPFSRWSAIQQNTDGSHTKHTRTVCWKTWDYGK